MTMGSPVNAGRDPASRGPFLPERGLNAGHFAFLRAVIQGVPSVHAYERFLKADPGEDTDARAISTHLAHIRQVLAAVSHKSRQHGTARLLRLDLRAVVGVRRKRGAAMFDAIDDESETTTLRPSARETRRLTLIERQLRAVAELEDLLTRPPRPGDGVAAWFTPELAARLHEHGIFTLAQLIDRINGLGAGWYTGIATLGEVRAKRVLSWLHKHQGTLQRPVGNHVAYRRSKLLRHELTALVRAETAVRPLEKFVVPAALDGSAGAFRRPQAHCLMQAKNDYEAIVAWIRSRNGLTPDARSDLKARRRVRDIGIERPADWLSLLSHTQRSYRKEAERFLLWAVIERKKPLSSMTVEDCNAYREFLADPQPASVWCGSRTRERWSPLWRPFEGPLSSASQRLAITVLTSLYAFWVAQGYVVGNPWAAIAQRKGDQPRMDTGRSLTAAQWYFVLEVLESRVGAETEAQCSSADRRLALALKLLYATGLRLSELVAARTHDLTWVQYPPSQDDDESVEGWNLRVMGKGQRIREVPVPTDIVGELSLYLESRGLDRDPEHPTNRDVYLLGKATDLATRAPNLARSGRPVDPEEGIAASTLYRQLKAFFSECSTELRAAGDAKGAERFARASTHWLRHTHASHAIAAGMPIEVAQQNLGHASLATTTVYVTTDQSRRMRAVNGFWEKSQESTKRR